MQVFQFENSIYLYGLLIIPILIATNILMHYLHRKKIFMQFEKNAFFRLVPTLSIYKKIWKFSLLMLALALLIITLANPQLGSKIEKGKRMGVDLLLAVDISNSMLAQDIQPNRLERSKMAISQLIDKLEGDRIGVIVFAGKAYPQLPITTDYASAKMFLSSVSTDYVNNQGTSLVSAIELGIESFDKNKESKTKKNKAIIIITDGEDHEEGAIEAASKALDQGIKVYTIGMGLPDGAPIPIYKAGQLTGYKKDKEGMTIMTKLNEEILQQISSAGGGSYVRANNTKIGLEKIFEDINSLNKNEIETRSFKDYEDRFQYIAIFVLFFLLLEFFIPERKSKILEKMNLFGKPNK